MSNFVQEIDDDEQYQSTVISQSSGRSPNPTENSADGSTLTTSMSIKRKRNFAGNPDPEAEVIALSPRTLMATNRYICEVCHKGFQRDQNLQLHRRGHNLPWKLKQRATTQAKKKVYVCPEPTCVHHDPSRALSDLTGIKKHFLSPTLIPSASLACLSSVERSYASPTDIDSAYTSATALLQKAAEMGAKISDNSIAPILLRGFTGYSMSSMNSSASALDGSPVVCSNIAQTAANINSLCAGESETFDKSFNPGYSISGYTISQGHLESPPGMPSANENTAISLREGYFEGNKMTVDFLGVEPNMESNMEKKSNFEGKSLGLGT